MISVGAIDTIHSDYVKVERMWTRIRDCMDGEDVIKDKKEKYLPRPAGMSGDYEGAYDNYIERAHFPLITSYALSGALGIVITKLPEFNVPKQLEYILKTATKDGKTIQQLFLDVVIEIFQTGRVPLLVDVLDDIHQFRFVQYKAEDFINWKTAVVGHEKNLILGVMKESKPLTNDIFSHEVVELSRVLSIDEAGMYHTALYDGTTLEDDSEIVPIFMGKTTSKIPLYLAGSINNSFDMQPIPLAPVANCSIQIYRKEADLANSEYLSCNPTLCIVGATNDGDLPNVVGSSVMIVLPNELARIFYTVTDTAALTHVKAHITDLYDEAIRHGVAILDARKGVEAAEALRIRQSTQSASIYSIFLAAMNAIKQGLEHMCDWAGYPKDQVVLDAPNSLTQGIPDSGLIKEMVEGFAGGVIPLPVIHRYLIYSGLLDQTIGYDEYLAVLLENKAIKDKLGLTPQVVAKTTDPNGTVTPEKKVLDKKKANPENV